MNFEVDGVLKAHSATTSTPLEYFATEKMRKELVSITYRHAHLSLVILTNKPSSLESNCLCIPWKTDAASGFPPQPGAAPLLCRTGDAGRLSDVTPSLLRP